MDKKQSGLKRPVGWSGWLFTYALLSVSAGARGCGCLVMCSLGIWKIIKSRRSEGQEKVRSTNRTGWDAWSYIYLSTSCKLPGVIGSAIPEWRNPSSFEVVYFLSTHLTSDDERPPSGFHRGPVVTSEHCDWLLCHTAGLYRGKDWREHDYDFHPARLPPNPLWDRSVDRRGPPQRPGNVKLLCSYRFKVLFLNADTQTWPCVGTGVRASFDSQI